MLYWFTASTCFANRPPPSAAPPPARAPGSRRSRRPRVSPPRSPRHRHVSGGHRLSGPVRPGPRRRTSPGRWPT